MRKLISLMLLMMVIVIGCKKDDPVISEYIVTFNTQGGSNIDALKVVEGQKVTKPQDPTKENYIFSGWYKEAACTTIWDFNKETVMGNVTIYAKWVEAAQACVVTFDAQGGSEVEPLTVNKGDKLAKPTNPIKEDCSFLGWYKDAAYTSAWEFATDVVNGDITLYARWSNPGEAVYTVTFDTDGGNEMEHTSVKANEKLTMPANPQKLGFKFRGWYSDAEKQVVYDFNSPVTGDITLYAKWIKSEIALENFSTSALAGTGVIWYPETKTLDITNAKKSGTLSFDVLGANTITPNSVMVAHDKHAKSIGGEDKLNEILVAGAAVSNNKIGVDIKTPVQTLNVPLDIYVSISDISNPEDAEVITIKSRPNYYNTEYKPVMMKTTDGKTVFWAPLNVGATKMPESVPNTADTDVTESCGQLFQWGRKSGVRATNKQETLDSENYTGNVFPTGEGYLSDMNLLNDKFIVTSSSNPNLQNNWLRFAEDEDNPSAEEMVADADAWYQKLWNSGTEENPVKTETDPCPEGWRVPTHSEWEVIGIGNTAVTKNWDDTNKLLAIDGADTESEQKFVLSAAGHRLFSNGSSNKQGERGYYWTSSVWLNSTYATKVFISTANPIFDKESRGLGGSVRCIQE
ncbi:InlB B-repeat-containing protein [Parabacteroides sp. APC149_11_2_Y6]